ncbi:uncharacterized protein BDW70DRAFT_147641 [Aspergillus foveolatus]|uniref:uncharacterized protein n=1 Tax=Aspergillus foveolatus TaxID=210207 RepID=UPI003CCDC32E
MCACVCVLQQSHTMDVHFPSQQLPCQLESTFRRGAFIVGVKMIFSDRTAWIVHFPHAWGPATTNLLGLGPFIMMDFIDGVSPSEITWEPNIDRPSRSMRETSATTWEQLVHQSNSTVGPSGLIPDSVHAKYDRCKFKSICDDLGLANLIVRARANLTVTGPPKIAFRYFKCIGIYIRVLEEEEAKMPHQEKELSSPIKWSQESGAMWFHMLLLRQHFGATEWARLEKVFDNGTELGTFAARKK